MANLSDWLPKSVLCLRSYTPQKFFADLLAGITVGLVALPLAMAFAIASGMPPHAGLYTALFAGGLISALGGSSTQIGGPTGAFVVVVAGIIARYGIEGLYICTLLAGVILIFMGVTGLGTAVRFIPRPVVVGFTNGIAILIASTQVKDFFALQIDKTPGEFIPRLQMIAEQWHTLSWTTTAASCAALAALIALVHRVTVVAGKPLGPARMLGRGPYAHVSCKPNHELVEKLKATLDELGQAARQGNWDINWQPLEESFRQAAAADQAGSFADAVREYCRAISNMMNELRLQAVRKGGATTITFHTRT